MIKGSSTRGADRVSVRAVLRGVPAAVKRPPRRRTKALVGWLIYCGVAVGGTAAAFTVRDALFPALGSAPTPNKVWGNTIAADETTEHNSTPVPGTDAFDQVVLAETDPTVTATSIDDATVPSVSNEGPGSSIDSHGPGTQTGPNTTVDDNPNRGPGPGTTVDDHDPQATSPTSVPHNDDPVTTATTTPDPNAPGTTVPDNSGKGKGGGGGGDSGGGGGGDHPTSP